MTTFPVLAARWLSLLSSNWLHHMWGATLPDQAVPIIMTQLGQYFSVLSDMTLRLRHSVFTAAGPAYTLTPPGIAPWHANASLFCRWQLTPIAQAMSLVTACSSPAISADVEQQFTGLLSNDLSGVEVHPMVTLTFEEFQFILILKSELKPLRHRL